MLWITKKYVENKRNKSRMVEFSDEDYFSRLKAGSVGALIDLPSEIADQLSKEQMAQFGTLKNYHQLLASESDERLLYKFLSSGTIKDYPYAYASPFNLAANGHNERQGIVELYQGICRSRDVLSGAIAEYESFLPGYEAKTYRGAKPSDVSDGNMLLTIKKFEHVADLGAVQFWTLYRKNNTNFNLISKYSLEDFKNYKIKSWSYSFAKKYSLFGQVASRIVDYIYNVYSRIADFGNELYTLNALLVNIVNIIDLNAQFSNTDLAHFLDAALSGKYQSTLALLNRELQDSSLLSDLLYVDISTVENLQADNRFGREHSDSDVNNMMAEIIESMQEIKQPLISVLKALLDITIYHRGLLASVAMDNGLTDYLDSLERMTYYDSLKRQQIYDESQKSSANNVNKTIDDVIEDLKAQSLQDFQRRERIDN